MHNWKKDNFNTLCRANGDQNPWLGDEFKQELSGEFGEQKVSEALELENGRIVFKEFGCEKRLSELEKKRLQTLLNRRTQCIRDTWEKQLKRLSIHVNETRVAIESIENQAQTVATELQGFLCNKAAEQFQNRAILPAERSISELSIEMSIWQKLELFINGLIQLASQTRMETENIEEEKKHVIASINFSGKVTGPFDFHLKRYINDKQGMIRRSHEDVTEEEFITAKTITILEMDNEDKVETSSAKKTVLYDIVKKIKIKDKENETMHQYLERLKQELAASEYQLDKLNHRSEELEKGRRVQQIFGASDSFTRA